MTAILRIEFCRYFGFYLVVLASFFGRHCTADVDECQKLPCLNGGTCHNQGGSYQCICMNGWTGVNCEINVDDCAKQPCLAGGTCKDKVGSYVCECPRGKTGLRCHLDDACISNPCHSGAVCETSPLNGDYMCSCPPGMNGTDCTVDINECIETALTPCEQGGTCVNTVGSFHCNCRNGFSGPRCEVNINECQSSPCRHDGSCLDKIGMFQCLCMDGFTGVTCETQVNECVSDPCQNGGTCQDKIGYFVCACPPGYSGTMCQMEIQECNSNPCQYGGNCTERINGFLCQCPPGTSGDRCQVNNNQCSKNNCLNGASCLRGANNFTCICLPGFSGPECEFDIDECLSRPCQNGGTCTDLRGGFRCDCASGYTDVTCSSNLRDCRINQCLNGGVCTDSNECQCIGGFTGFRCESEVNECNSNPCQHGGSCIDHLNLYVCVCPVGFTGGNCEFNGNDCSPNPCQNGGQCIDGINGYSCVCNRSYTGPNCETKINVCASNVCQNGGQCSSDTSPLGFICSCPIGFTGERCSDDVNECVVGSGNPCRNGGTCRNSIGSYSCSCPAGYSGQMCEVNSNDCSSDSCKNGGTCVDGLNNYTCYCVPGYNGNKCQFDVNECQSSPCQNGATCNNYVNSYTCTCAPGFSGTNCQINDNDCTSSLCLNGGTCVDGVNTYSCHCPSGYDRSNCEHQVTACDSNPCLNDGSCEASGSSSYRCFCAPGWTGQSCNILVDWCGQVDPVCKNGGTCGPTGNTFQCSCAVGWTGSQCDVANVSCVVAAQERGVNVSALCHNGGTCYNYYSAHQCACSPGYEGTYCENKTDNCRSQPCLNGANCSNVNASFQCTCRPGFVGRDCSVNINECYSNPCRNNGTCHDLVNGFQCSCPPGTSGIYCEVNPNDCLSPGSCQNGGTCYDKVNGYGCYCAPGFTGPNCQGDIDECGSGPCSGPGILGCVQGTGTFTCLCKPGWTGANCSSYLSQCAAAGSNPCERGGTCMDLGGGPSSFKCTCPPGFGGLYCQNGSCENNPCQNGGSCSLVTGQSLCQCPPDYTGKTCDQLISTAAICEANNCKSKAGNGKCDPECDAYVCQYDNYECSYTSSIYKNCKAIKDGIPCYALVNNGHCDSECNNEDCLYDGWDCKNMTVCNPIYDAYCKSHFKDGNCDQGCNTEECGWDGLDCVQTKDPRYADGVLVIVVLVPVDVFVKNSADFLRNLSLLLHGTLVIKKDKNGADMVYSWPDGEDGYFQRRKRSVWDWFDVRQRRSALSGTKFYAKLDNTNCQAQCFPDAELAAEFLAQSMRQGYDPGYPLYSVNSEPDSSTNTDRPATVPVVVSVISIVVVVVVVAVVVTELRKRGYGKTWFPEGFCFLPITHSVHRGQDSSKRVMSFSSSDAPPSTAESVTSCSDDESFHSKAKRHKSEKEDSRGWTRIHLEAAGTIPKPAILPFTPPQNDQHEIRDINVRGPGGLTPLMLASMASSEMPCMGYEGHDGTSIITELINDGASIHCKTDHTGETPLHLAARYSRSDAAKRLLDAGADPNVPDNLGRTPLHAAVTADAVGVFQILLRHRMTTVNARMKDGTTPLILAVRLAIEGIVEELINAEADVGAADDLGKTALHWAAAVNNVTAAMLLLRHGANKDAQDDHNQTPLFVAAREGSRDVALLLLQNSASIDIPDHVEHLPRDIALERCHHDIVQLLDNYSFNLASDGMGGTSVSAVMSSYMAQGAKSKQKRPSKKQRVVKETELHKIDHCLQFPPHLSGQFVHLPLESAKKQKKRSVGPGFASPSSRGCVRATIHGNGMDMANRMIEYPPSYDQSCQGRRGQYMTQATLSSLSGSFMDPLDMPGAYQGAGAMLGGDGHQDQAMAVHNWYSFDDYPNQFAGGLDHNMQWPGHVSSTIPKTDLAFGSYGDGYLCQQQSHPYQEETANALDMLDSSKFGVCPSDNGTINQNCQYDDVNSHVGAYPVLDVHELPLNSKNRQMLSAFDDKNFFQINNQPNTAVLFDSGKILPSMSTYDKTNAAVAHGQDPTSSTGAVIKNSAFMDNSPTAGVQSFLHPSAKGSPDDCGHSMHHMKPTKYVLPLSQYPPFPQQRAQSCSNEASLVASERPADPARSGLQKPSFPTPPSQHDLQSDTPPQQLSSCVPRELYPTPSPDSLSPWSNSPIQSAKPDWLDKIKHSPHQPARLPAQSISGLKEEPSFFV